MNRTLSTVIDFVLIPATATAAVVVVSSLLPVSANENFSIEDWWACNGYSTKGHPSCTQSNPYQNEAKKGKGYSDNTDFAANPSSGTSTSKWNEQSDFYEKGDYGQAPQCPAGTSYYTLGKEVLRCMTAYEAHSIRNHRQAMRQQWRQNVLRNIQQGGPTVCTGSTNTYGNYTYGQAICN